jgi:hypothetical protein
MGKTFARPDPGGVMVTVQKMIQGCKNNSVAGNEQ